MLRMLLAMAMFVALMRSDTSSHIAALALFLAAIVTDWIDGYVARRINAISAFGKIADPIADKILVLGAFIALLKNRELGIPLWGVFLILARELLLGGVRTLAAVQGKVLAAERWGKWKMAVQCMAVLLILTILVLRGRMAGLPPWMMRLPHDLTVLCVVVTWGSAVLYFRQSRGVIESSWR